ncbi:MAG: globin [Campylobacterota bacterium]|nr:globin [Campylobacterota bacterium]
MSYEVTETIQGEAVDFTNPAKEFYEALGYDGMKDLMDRFYDKVFESEIATFFPQDEEEFEEVRAKNTLFFIQLCGGPKIYDEGIEEKGLNEHMIKIHEDFSINEKARLEWLGCMQETLKETDIAQELKDNFWDYVERFSKLTVNSFPEECRYVSSL